MRKYFELMLIALYAAFAPVCFMAMTTAPHTAQILHAMHGAYQEEPASATPIQTITEHQEMYQSVTFAVFLVSLLPTLLAFTALLSRIYRYVAPTRRKSILLRARPPGVSSRSGTPRWLLRHIASPPHVRVFA